MGETSSSASVGGYRNNLGSGLQKDLDAGWGGLWGVSCYSSALSGVSPALCSARDTGSLLLFIWFG